MHEEQKRIVDQALKDHRMPLMVRSEEGDLDGWYTCPKTNKVASSHFEEYAKAAIDSLCQLAHQADVRLFVGSQYPLLTNHFRPEEQALYAIPGLPVTELVEIFEVGQGKLEGLPNYDLFVEFASNDPRRSHPPMDRRTYNDLILRRKAPWYHIRKTLNRIAERLPFEIISVAPTQLTLRMLQPVAENEAVFLAKIIKKMKPEPGDVPTFESLLISVSQTHAVQLSWAGPQSGEY